MSQRDSFGVDADLLLGTPPGGYTFGDDPTASTALAPAPKPKVDVAATAKRVAATGVGAAVGAMAAGPLGLVIGGALGAAVDYYRAQEAKKTAAGPSLVAALNASAAQGIKFKTLGASPMSTAAVIAKLSQGSAANGGVKFKPLQVAQVVKAQVPSAPPVARLANIATAAATGVLDPAAKAAATALYDYFEQYPGDRIFLGDTFWQSPHTLMLVGAFQNAYNSTDKPLGVLRTDGVYDNTTAAALTLYTHDPIAPNPNA
jgi:hypothetical protein